jgi:rhomboid family protein
VPLKDAKKAERPKAGSVRFSRVIPYKDENPTELAPVITIGIIALNVLTWLFVQGAGEPEALARSVCHLGLIPGEVLRTVPPGTAVPLGDHLQCVLTADPSWRTLLTSMFMHGGWLHLIGNMWFLWVFGNNIEDSMGHTRFILFYLLCGVAAAATQMAVDPTSKVPMVGASGAISGVMGAYILLYPRVRVHTLVTLGFFLTTITLPAYVMLGYWFVLQLLLGAATSLSRAQGGVAVWAHVGGFLAGLVLIKLFANAEYLERHRPGVVILPRDA